VETDKPMSTTPEAGLDILAFLFAERVVIDKATGRYTLVGVFDTIELEKDQKDSTPWCVYVLARGDVIFAPENAPPDRAAKVSLIISSGDCERVKSQGTVSLEGSLAHEAHDWANVQVNFHIPLPAMPIPAGKYDVSLLVNDNHVATRPLAVNRDD